MRLHARPLALSLAALLALVARTAGAHDAHDADHDEKHDDKTDAPPPPPKEAEPPPPEQVTVRAEKPASESGSRVNVGGADLALRPRMRPADVLEATPGLFAVQHAGGGKANQYFLRGFDADHGTDVAFFVDGVPVNMPSHGHGQGYSDFHFLIPELVLSLDAYKGPYFAQYGDFATAGAINLRLVESVPESSASMQIGQYGVARGVVIASPRLDDHTRATFAVELAKQDGPWLNPERLGRVNVFARVAHDFGKSKLVATWMSYGSRWYGSGQIPARAVCGEGEPGVPPPSTYGGSCIDHFGYVDPTEGGASQRHLASVAWSWANKAVDVNVMGYAMYYQFGLYSNFTFFDRDPVNGDEIEQTDERLHTGLDVRVRQHTHVGKSVFQTTVGAQTRVDLIDAGLFHDVARSRLSTTVDAGIVEAQTGAWIEEDARLLPWLRAIAGLRFQRADVSVKDRVGDASGASGAFAVLPKLLFSVTPEKHFTLFASWGRGFHTNDARGVVQRTDPADLITPVNGWEVGARVTPVKNLQLSAVGFLVDVASEQVWVGDEGTTEPSGRTRRLGLELDARYRLTDWLYADASFTLTSAKYRDLPSGEDEVPLAPRRTFSAGIGVRRKVGDFTPFFGFRVKSIADRPANEDGSLVAQGFTVADVDGGVRWKNVELGVDAQNLFDARWREVSFATTSRLAGEPAPVNGIHYTPGWPLTVTGKATVYWE